MNKKPYLLLLVVLLLGWAFDFLFWEKHVGLNFAIFAALCLLGGAGLLLAGGMKPARKSLLLILPFAFFTIISAIRQEPVTLLLAYAFSIFSMGLLVVTYLGGRWVQYSLFDYGYKAIQLIDSLLVRPFTFFQQVRKEQAELGQLKRAFPVKPVLRGFAIALPIVVGFASLLASADLIFNQKLIDFFDRFNLENITEDSLRLVIILLCAYVLAAVFLHAGSKSRDEKLIGEGKPVIPRFLGFTEAGIVLSSVAALFVLFVILQFRYFFGGEVNIGVEGYTYSEYARSGFNELVTVACLSLLLTLGLSTITRREEEVQKRIFSGLSVAIAALVGVMLFSAYQRLSLAIDWHGFSRLRIYPRVFMVWVGILFLVVVVLEIVRRERYFVLAALLASFGFAISLSLLNVDAEIVHHNVSRAAADKHFNVNYLSALSTDAIPALAQDYHDVSLPKATREGIGAALICYQYSRNIPIDPAEYDDWRSFNYSQIQASRTLADIQRFLVGYRVNIERPLVRIGTPSDAWYECAY